MTLAPVNLTAALASFDEVYSPRIVARVNDYDVRIAHARGEHVWHVHEDTDEFFLVLDGQFEVAIRDRPGRRPPCCSGKATHSSYQKAPSTSRRRPAGRYLMFEPLER